MKIKHLIFILLLPLFAVQCEKETIPEEPVLPPITQTGAYTFGCLLDGQVWLPKHYSNSVLNPPVVLQADLDVLNGNLFQVIASHDRKDDNSKLQILGLFTFTERVKDTVVLPPSKTGTLFVYEQHPPKNGGIYRKYFSTGNKNSWVYLSRFDTVKRIASGTFSVDLLNEADDLDTVRIREGRFDVPF